ncbi:MAG: hypothetical protein IT516_15540 [Burkholderiales bacterium]|nr:hypothetical protein [Burkholderiales bacterium]
MVPDAATGSPRSRPAHRGPRAEVVPSPTLRAVGALGALVLVTACSGTPESKSAGHAATPAPSGAVAPPSPTAATVAAVRVVNPGFESATTKQNGDPEGWFSFQHAGVKSFDFILDTAQPRSGAKSLRIDNVGPEPYGAIAQAFDVRGHRGKVARYSAWLRTRDVAGPGAVLTLMTFAKGAIVDHEFLGDRALTGTVGWTHFTLSLPVAPDAERIEIGAMLQGKGSLWFDDATLEIVGR